MVAIPYADSLHCPATRVFLGRQTPTTVRHWMLSRNPRWVSRYQPQALTVMGTWMGAKESKYVFGYTGLEGRALRSRAVA